MNLKLSLVIARYVFIVALIIGILSYRAALADEERDHSMTAARLSVSNSSIENLEQEIDRMTREARRLASGDAARIAASKQAVQMANAVAKVRQAAIDRLNQSAIQMSELSVEGQCEASPELLKEWPA